MKQTIRVSHNVEMAHCLSLTPGKCSQIHGHSWKVILSLTGKVDTTGKLIEFGQLKALFREHLDRNYDHRLLLNKNDTSYIARREIRGVTRMDGDPTTENFARLIYDWAIGHIVPNYNAVESVFVEVWETSTNCATYGAEL